MNTVEPSWEVLPGGLGYGPVAGGGRVGGGLSLDLVAEIKANVARFVAGEPLTNVVRAGR